MSELREIRIEELQELPEREYVLIDVRDEGLREYGMLPGARYADAEALERGDASQIEDIPKDKKLIARLKEENPFVEANIFGSMENVNLDTVVAYKKNGVRHHFLEEY